VCYVADVLFKNGSLVKVLCHIVTGSPDNLDAPFVRLLVRVAAGERGKEGKAPSTGFSSRSS
jgi:hypothetical protein